MDRTTSEKIISSISYAITLAGLVLVLVFVMGNEWMPQVVAGFGAASAGLAAACWHRSRYILVHALNALLLYLHTAALSTVPLIIGQLLRHGHLLPRAIGPFRVMMNPVPFTLGAICIFVGLPLLMITSQALTQSLQGEFIANWPPLRWLRDRLLER